MGKGIAIAFAYAGIPVTIVDSEPRPAAELAALAADVHAALAVELGFLHEIGLITAAQAARIAERVTVIGRDASAAVLAEATFVFEAVLEVAEVKQSVYAWLGEATAPATILASTTSTMSANLLAQYVTRPERFLNAHWLNPAHLMPLVEVSPAAVTAAASTAAMTALLERAGKVPIVCKASPGYIVPRIQALAMNEAARLVEEGVASAADVDQAIRVGFGIRFAVLGMLEFIDWGGGDILYYASSYLAENLDPQRFQPAEVVRRNMQEHRTGLRDSVGFYDYRDRDIQAYRRERLAAFIALARHMRLLPAPADP
jgi:3-hydroxybutyryl-CoA dehydrogenase